MLRILFQHFFLALTISFFFWPKITLAAEPPKLVSPPDNSTEKSPKLSWEYTGGCIENGSCFVVEVDNSSDFSSPEKSSYTNNFSYSPQNLTEGLWHWRVKAKDKTDKWSGWSQVFKFIIGSPISSSAASTSPIPQISPAPPISPTTQKSQTNFEIKDNPSEINSNQDFEISVSLKLPNNPNQSFYLKGAFKKGDSSNYFGQTQVNNDWIKNNEKYSKQLKIQTNSSGNWEGKIKIKPDSDDSGFEGSDNYIFKVGRYSDSGSGPSWSNDTNLKINAVEIPDPSPASEEIEESLEESTESAEIDLISSIVQSSPRNYEIKIASVAGVATISDNTNLESEIRVLEEKKINWLLIILGFGILISGGGFTFYKFRQGRIPLSSRI